MGYFQWNGDYNGISLPTSEGITALVAEVEIQAGTNVGKVYSSFSTYIYAPKLFASAFLSYPDPRARRITIYEVLSDGTWMKVFSEPLQRHNLLNLSYYLSNDLKPIVGVSTPDPILPPITTNTVTLLEPNKIKVSELNNPLSFSNTNTYQSGNGTIIAMATNAIRISEGQFGQYPLYVFTTQGIYSLDVGQGEVVYSNKTAPTSYEIPTTAIAASTPFGVVFTSVRGICIIRGQEVELLTAQLQETPRQLNIQFLPAMEGLLHNYGQKSFTEYLREIESIVYNPFENELIITDNESEFNYVLNLYSKSFYQSTEKVDLVVGNTFPDLFVVEDKKLKNFEHINLDLEGIEERANVSFILRPIQFGSHYIKWLQESILFTNLYDTDRLIWGTNSSNDGVNFRFTKGFMPKDRNNYTKLDLARIGGNKFSHFLFIFGATVSHKSWINNIDSLVLEEYQNRSTR